MGDNLSDTIRIGLTIITICFIACVVLSVANVALRSGQDKLEKGIEKIETDETVTLTEKELLAGATDVKDKSNNVTVNEADTVINAETYNDYSIVNEAEQVSYVAPLTITAICAFIAVMYYMKNKFKVKHDENTLEILKSPKTTYSSLEVEELKKKYDEIEPDDKYREIDSGIKPL